MTDEFAEWRRLERRRQLALRERLCTCCAFIHRIGDPGPRPVRAVCEWITPAGNRELLCAECLRLWRENAAADPELAPVEVLTFK
jgi:hypothetical protein